MIDNIILLTFAVKHIGGGLLQLFGDFCPSIRPSLFFFAKHDAYGKGSHRESTHSSYK